MIALYKKLLPARAADLLDTYDRLTESEASARATLADAEEHLTDAIREDEHAAAAVAYSRASGDKDAEEPTPTAPVARQRVEDAQAGLRSVRGAVEMVLTEIASVIAEADTDKTLDKAEAKAQAAATAALDEVEVAARALAEVRAHRAWITRPVHGEKLATLGNVAAIGREQLAALHTAIKSRDDREDGFALVREREAWNSLVQRARATLGMEPDPSENDAAIEREIDALRKAGKPIPRPTSHKWVLKLGLDALHA